MHSRLHRILFCLLLALLALVSYLLLIELPPKPMGWPWKDKLQHAGVFLLLGGVALLACRGRLLACCLALALYGGLMEWLQGVFTVTRIPSWWDWLADVVGIALALGLVLLGRYCFAPAAEKKDGAAHTP